MSDRRQELIDALSSPEVARQVKSWISEVVGPLVQAVAPDADQLLTVDQAAALLGMSPGALYKAAQRGQLRRIGVGRRIRFRRGDLVGRVRKTAPTATK